MWKRALGFGVLLAVGAASLQGLAYQRLARPWLADGQLFLVAAAFLLLGVWLGVQLWRRGTSAPTQPVPLPDAVGPLPPFAASSDPEQGHAGAHGPAFLSPAGIGHTDLTADTAAPTQPLSARELTVLHELAAGRTNKEIAQRLHLSPHTVKTHVAHVFEKLGARRRTEAINKARQQGIVR